MLFCWILSDAMAGPYLLEGVVSLSWNFEFSVRAVLLGGAVLL